MKNPLDFLLDDPRCAALAPAALGAIARLSLRYLRGDLPGDNEAVRMLAGVDPEQWPWVLDALLPFLASDAAGNLRIVPLIEAKEAAARRSESSRRNVEARWWPASHSLSVPYPFAIKGLSESDQQAVSDHPATPPTEPEQFALSPLCSVVYDLPKKTEEGEEAKKGRAKLPRRTFAPPTEQDVLTHMLEIAPEMQVSPEMARKQSQTFMCHFGAAGWYTSNRRRMHDWKCAARGWLIREKKWASERSTNGSTAATPKTGLRNKVYDDWKSPNSHTTTPTVLL